MRRLGIDPEDVAAVVRNADSHDTDPAGRTRLTGRLCGRRIRVILGAADPETAVSVHPFRRGRG